MDCAWRGAPSIQLPQKAGPTAVQRMLQEQQGRDSNPQSYTARLEPRPRRAQFEWPPRRAYGRVAGVAPDVASVLPSARQYFSPAQAASTKGLKRVTWPPPLDDDLADGEQDPVYSQAAPAVNGFAAPNPQFAEQVTRQGRQGRPVQPHQQTTRRSASRDRRSPAWTPPPTVISLRQSPPIHQEPVAVYVSQPATASMQASVESNHTSGALQNGHQSRTNSSSGSPVPGSTAAIPSKPTRTLAFATQGGVRARGDAKWPPQEYKTRAEEENAQRVALAKGPVCRPRLPKRDYSGFFEQNRVNSMYPGYRAPPGTQHYVDETGVSEF